MKLIFICALSSLLMTSCMKKYSCKCKTTISAQYYYPHETETYEDLPKHTSKKKAKQICDNTAKQMRENVDLLISDDFEVGTKCELKDY